MNNDFIDAKVGDKVWSSFIGHCKIIDIKKDKSYPLVVSSIDDTDDSYMLFTLTGLHYGRNKYPTLFHKKPDWFK